MATAKEIAKSTTLSKDTEEMEEYLIQLDQFKTNFFKLLLDKNFPDKQIKTIKKQFKDKIDNNKKAYIEAAEKILPDEDIKKLWGKSVKQTEKKIEGLPRGKKDIRESVLMDLTLKNPQTATETMVTELLEREVINTIRDDEKLELFIYKEGIRVAQGKSYIMEYCREILGEAYTGHLYQRVLSKVITDTFINAKDFFKEQDINKIVVENGILDLRTKKLEPFNPKYIFFQKIPVKYDPSAKCPAIQKHFKEVLEHEEDSHIIQESIGLTLYREYFIEKSLMFYGGGRNGKSKTISLLKQFLGIENVAGISIQELETDTFAASRLLNKLANLCGDLSKAALKESGMFKKLTGRDLITANRKHLPRVDFVNHATMIFACNELPTTYDLTIAFFNRWILLKFPFTFLSDEEMEKIPEKERKNIKLADVNILQKMTTEAELSGLLNWGLQGLERLLKNSEFSHSRTTEETRKLWVRNSNSFNGFCEDILQEDYEGRITKADLRAAYFDYCKKNKLISSGDKAIKEILSKTFGVSEDRYRESGQQITYWDGIIFKGSGKGGIDGRGFTTYIRANNSPIREKPHTEHTEHTANEEKIKDQKLKVEEENITGKGGKGISSEETEPKSTEDKIAEYMEEKKEMVMIENIEAIFPKNERGVVEPALHRMKRKGDVEEPKNGYWRFIQ